MSENQAEPNVTPNINKEVDNKTKDVQKTVEPVVKEDIEEIITSNSKNDEEFGSIDIANLKVAKEIASVTPIEKKVDEMPEAKKKPVETKKAMAPVKNPKPKKKHNYILWAGIIVVMIPCLLLGWLLLSTREKAGAPTVGDRFENALDPAITSEQVNEVKSAMAFDSVDQVEVNLISATLRINIDVQDDMDEDAIKQVAQEAYDKVHGILPIETYFTNKDGDKMYDIEINVYNFIPEAEQEGQIHVVKSKTAAAESDRLDVLTSAKNADIADDLLNPDLTVPDTSNEVPASDDSTQ